MGFWSKLKSAFKKVAAVALPVVAIVAPAIIPFVGAAVLPVGASTAATFAAGSAVITTAGQLAAGASPQQAIKAGAVAGVSGYVGGTVAAAKGVPVGSVAGSAAGTVVAGGSAQDIIRNAVSAGVGAGVGETALSKDISPSTSQALGQAAGTLAVTGGNVQAAITSAVNSEIQSLAKQGVPGYQDSATKQLQQAAADVEKNIAAAKATPGTQLAQADTGTVSDVTSPVLTGVPGQDKTGGVTVTGTQPGAIDVMPYLQTDVTKTTSPTKTTPTATVPTTPSSATKTPTVTAPVLPNVPGQTPTGEVKVYGTTRGTPEEVQPYLQTEVQTLPEVKVTATQEPTAQETAKQEPAKEEPAKEEAKPAGTPKPILSPIYFTGVTPAAASPLAQGLGTAFSALPTTGLTAERGAGEIESKETGKARQNVWNEASLRLKDALGV